MKILIIGEVCLDTFVYGNCPRLSPEGPAPIFQPFEQISNLGMAGNIMSNVESILKNDTTISDKLPNEVDVEIIHQTIDDDVISKKRFIDKNSNQLIVRIDEHDECEDVYYYVGSNTFKDKINEADLVIVSDYNKGFLPIVILEEIAAYASLSILDSKKILPIGILNSFDIIKMNTAEFSKYNIEPYDSILDKIIVTHGSDGAMYKDKLIKVDDVYQTIDVSGAGDTFLAAFSLKYYITENITQSIKYANKIASMVVSKKGVATPW